MGNCCESSPTAPDHCSSKKPGKTTLLQNGEEIDESHYSKPANLEKISKIQASFKGNQCLKTHVKEEWTTCLERFNESYSQLVITYKKSKEGKKK